MMNILLPTDFSENSRNAAAYAVEFFKDTPCNFHLLHVVPVPTDNLSTGYMCMSPAIKKNFSELITWLETIRTNKNHSFQTYFKADYLINAVRAMVQERKIDLILMGTKGKTNNEGVVIGNNTSDVMMKVKCPVLAISEHASFKEHKKILFPTDYKIHYGSKVLRTLLNLASLSKANVKILEIFNSDKEPSLEQIENREFLQDSFSPRIPVLQTYYTSSEENPKKILIANRDVDMIVLAAKNLNLCQKFLRNEDDQNIPFINQLPLLVLHG
ncbi:universal stress protein [Salinimicrobium xinjiangense]|uniref:universal stress protein n=1 Tax=Salinimicrobium xinjiangense TaxID=438596 RepID=UPI0003F822EB|nr:universal stress protein [Salinimicrobium xinjiangense]